MRRLCVIWQSFWMLCCMGLVLAGADAEAAPSETTPPPRRAATPIADKASPAPTTPSKAVPGKAAPEKTAPEKTAPTPTAPGKTVPEKAAPAQRAKPSAVTAQRSRKSGEEGDEFNNEEYDRYRYRYRDPQSSRNNRRNRRYRRYRRYRRPKPFKGPPWRASRFFWSTEVGCGMFRYLRYSPGREPVFHFNSFTISGRWGFASRYLIFTGDIMYGFGNADNLRDGGFLGHLGITLSVLPLSYLSVDFGTGLRMVTSFDSSMSSPALLFPIDVGFTLRIPWKTVSLGIRCLGSFSFGFEGVGVGFHTMLVLSRT